MEGRPWSGRPLELVNPLIEEGLTWSARPLFFCPTTTFCPSGGPVYNNWYQIIIARYPCLKISTTGVYSLTAGLINATSRCMFRQMQFFTLTLKWSFISKVLVQSLLHWCPPGMGAASECNWLVLWGKGSHHRLPAERMLIYLGLFLKKCCGFESKGVVESLIKKLARASANALKNGKAIWLHLVSPKMATILLSGISSLFTIFPDPFTLPWLLSNFLCWNLIEIPGSLQLGWAAGCVIMIIL